MGVTKFTTREDEHTRPTVEAPPLFSPPHTFEDGRDSGGIPEPIQSDARATKPMTSAAADTTMTLAPPPIDVDATVPTRVPAPTLLGVVPVAAARGRSSVPRIAMPALAPTVSVGDPELAGLAVIEQPPVARRRGMWARVFGRVSALLRRLRWAYRRRRGVRASVRRLPTRT